MESAEAIDAISRMPPSPAPPVVEGLSPVKPVEDAFEAARKGDLDAYLDQFTDPLKSQMLRLRTEKGDAYLRDYLARLCGPIKGISADLTRQESVGPDTIRLPVEFIYADHNEVQTFQLRREGGRWRVLQIATVRSAPTLIPYGTGVVIGFPFVHSRLT
jgi:hypothetical protein